MGRRRHHRPTVGRTLGGGADAPSPAPTSRVARVLLETQGGRLLLVPPDPPESEGSVRAVISSLDPESEEWVFVPVSRGDPVGSVILRPRPGPAALSVVFRPLDRLLRATGASSHFSGVRCPICSEPLLGAVARCRCGCSFHAVEETGAEAGHARLALPRCPNCGLGPSPESRILHGASRIDRAVLR